MEKQFDILKKSRALMLKIIDGLSMEEINEIPHGFNNNIAWNISHLVVTQQLLCYRNSNVSCCIPEKLIEDFKKGTAPDYSLTEEEFSEIKRLFLDLPVKFEADYYDNKFVAYNSYTTSVNITLNTINDAVEFNNFHEGIHLGILLQLRRLVSK